MESHKRAAVFHRNRLFRDCLITFLDDRLDHHVEAVDHGHADVVDELRDEAIELILLDVSLPDGLAPEIVRFTSAALPSAKVLLLIAERTESLLDCIAAGAHGCVFEQASIDELLEAIDRVCRGEVFCSPELVSIMFQAIARTANLQQPQTEQSPKTRRLTLRELEVLELLNQRKSNKEIASALSVSLFTVKNHVRNILEKLNVENRMEAVDVARRQRTVGW